MKKKLFVLLPLLGIAGTIAFTSCGNSTNGGNNQGGIINNPDIKEESVEGINNSTLGNIQTITSMNLLSFMNNGGGATLASLENNLMDRDYVSETEKEEIIKMLPTLDLLLNEDLAYTSTVIEETNVINEVSYSYKEEITYLNNSATYSSIKLYFNVTGEWNEKDDDDDENELIQTLEGVALLNNDSTYYPFKSVTKEENEWDEKESERSFFIDLGNNSSILVEEESENEEKETETEFSYKIRENGRLVEEYSISIETEGTRKEVSYELNEIEYEMKKVTRDGVELYKVEYENEEGRDEVEATLYFIKTTVDGVTTFSEYTF